jgi:hypothetical protein
MFKYVTNERGTVLGGFEDHTTTVRDKGGRSANKFRKSQIRKFADLNNLWHLADLRFADPIFFVICRFVNCRFPTCGFKFFGRLETSTSLQNTYYFSLQILL